MQDIKNLFEEVDLLEAEQQLHREKMINLVKDKLFGFLDENELNLVIDYMNYSEKLNSRRSALAHTLENQIRVLNHSEVEKVSEMAIKIDKDISKELNEVYQSTTIKSYINGIIRSIKPNTES